MSMEVFKGEVKPSSISVSNYVVICDINGEMPILPTSYKTNEMYNGRIVVFIPFIYNGVTYAKLLK